ncbi:Hypothetical predicted protein [Paramuricea clavata]|uniref:DnaJ homolog subfamily B member 9 n=1 Tax=Paramuricea clavata TaxID=317549 RepID=A0A6S7JYA3_PARCT|nr:Hypothetical predicted protein [Paramuricea clavata]
MAKEILTAGSKNLYEILNLNMDEVRGKPVEEQNKIIKRAYHSQLRRWHPDRNPENGDSAICQEIIFAYKILKYPEARAAYNNVADFDKGWFSKARYKAMFKPECYSAEQKKQKRRRLGLLFLSGLFIAAGVGLTFVTAGMAAPVVLGVSAASGALIGGGISSGLRTISRESIEKGCSFRKYFTSLAIGAIERLDDDVENKSILGHIKNGAEQAAIAVGKCLAVAAAKVANKKVSDGGKATGINGESGNQNKLTDDMYEETNDETRKDTNNTTKVAKDVAKTAEEEGINTTSAYKDSTGASDDIGEEVEDSNNATKEDECEENIDDDDKTDNDSSAELEKKQTKSHLPDLPRYKSSLTSETNNSNEEQTVSDSDDSTECAKPILMKYFSEGYWFSKMLVDYKENGETKHYEVKGSESSIPIPNKATKIKVRFQVMRFLGTWCDVKRYDRFKKCWIEPNQPHTFEYNTPVNRTYTLSGNLYYEAVMNITGDYDNLNEI